MISIFSFILQALTMFLPSYLWNENCLMSFSMKARPLKFDKYLELTNQNSDVWNQNTLYKREETTNLYTQDLSHTCKSFHIGPGEASTDRCPLCWAAPASWSRPRWTCPVCPPGNLNLSTKMMMVMTLQGASAKIRCSELYQYKNI